jgi:hypothetical protein
LAAAGASGIDGGYCHHPQPSKNWIPLVDLGADFHGMMGAKTGCEKPVFSHVFIA